MTTTSNSANVTPNEDTVDTMDVRVKTVTTYYQWVHGKWKKMERTKTEEVREIPVPKAPVVLAPPLWGPSAPQPNWWEEPGRIPVWHDPSYGVPQPQYYPYTVTSK